MAVIYCHICDRLIDLDWDVDHEAECKLDHGLVTEEQLELEWAREHVRDGDPTTSIAAAESMQTDAQKHCGIVLDTLRKAGIPLSAEEVSDRCELDFPQVWRRMSDLKNRELIVKAGTRARNRSNRMADRFKPAGGLG